MHKKKIVKHGKMVEFVDDYFGDAQSDIEIYKKKEKK